MITIVLLILLLSTPAFATDLTLSDIPAHVCFTPGDRCAAKIIDHIRQAKEEILMQAYSFTSAPIAKALVEAHKRGVKVEIILDKSQRKEKYSPADFTAHAGIPTYIDSQHAIAHNKVMVIDRKTVITGSYNFTRAAEEKNAENLLIVESAKLAEEYRTNWMRHKEHSESYAGK
jgi:phosphatidylserine/phosphatidylglycerophosphate/cardiolipin synthase-like enzyme